MRWHLTTYRHIRDTFGEQRSFDWRGLVALLTTPVVLADDAKAGLQLPTWSPAVFRGVRCLEHATEVGLLVLDYDARKPKVGPPLLAPDPWTIHRRWSHWPHIVHTTWSHLPDAPRCRVVVPLARPVPARAWPSAWSWAHQRDPFPDASCKDASRAYYLPAVPASRPHWSCIVQPDGAYLELGSNMPNQRSTPSRQYRRRDRPDHDEHRRLREDPDARRAWGLRLGGRCEGEGDTEVVRGVPCPSCGRDSAWWNVQPRRFRGWWCNHRETCGASGWLDQLEGVA
jgi:hypothetical protein